VRIKPHKVRKKHARRGEAKEYPFYPNHLIRILIAVMGTVCVIATLAAIFPLPLDHIADPLAKPEAGIQALWILKPAILLGDLVFRPALTVVLVTIFAVLFVLLPTLDRSGQRSIKRRALVALPFLLWMLFLAWSLLLSTGGIRG
jgi:quinol-cytochrome oxidoreductase complex cytochrome b subunit